MLEVYKKYQERLINLSSRNASIVLNSLAKKRNFDILQLDDYFNKKTEEVLDFIKCGKKKILILQEPQAWLNGRKREVKKEIKALNSDFTSLYKGYKAQLVNKAKYKESLSEINFQIITEDACEKAKFVRVVQEELLAKEQKRYEKLVSLSKGLDYLNREIRFEINETGISNFYLACSFVEGKFLDGSKSRAPLSLLAVALVKEKGSWYITNPEGNEPEPNKVFLLSAKKNNQLKEICSDFTYDSELDIEGQFLDHYKKSGIIVETGDEEYKKFPKYTAAESYKGISNGSLELKKHIILGRFPTANAIYEDYDYLLKQQTANDQIRQLFGKMDSINEKNNQEEKSEQADLSNKDLNEKDFYFISSLDHSQEIAVKKVDEGENLVIFGPPGTGKSETIANIIADNVSKGKRILMVSQKRAALDVIYNRLSSMKSKIALIHDAEKGKKEFYNKIRLKIDQFEEQYGSDFHYTRKKELVKTNHRQERIKIRKMGTQIESNLDNLRELVDILNKPQKNGESYGEICQRAWKEKDLDKEEKSQLSVYMHHKKDIVDFSFDQKEIEAFCQVIKENNLVAIVTEFDELRLSNRYFEGVKESPDFSVIYDLENKVIEINEIVQRLKEGLKDEDYKYAYDVIVKEKEKAIHDFVQGKYGYLLEPLATGIKRVAKLIFTRKALLGEEESNRQQYEQHLKDNKAYYDEIESSFKNIEQLIGALEGVLLTDEVKAIKHQVLSTLECLKYEDFVYLRDHYARYLTLDRQIKEYCGSKIDFIRSMVKISDENIKIDQFIELYPQMYRYDLISNQVRYQPDIVKANESIHQYTDNVKMTKELMKSKSQNVEGYIHELWDEKFARSAKEHLRFTEFKRLAKLKTRLRPIRQYYENYDSILSNMFPVFLMGPETVSKVLPMKKDMFDLILFDEASQMFVEEAVPSLFRGKKVVVAGDDKQLKPTGLFRKTIDEQHDEDDLENAAALEEESLLDLSKYTYMLSHLRFHYRSKYAELINFSNYAFYDGKLKLSPNVHEDQNRRPIERIYVSEGTWIDRANIEEAKEVVRLIKQILLSRKEEETIGVITFNTSQKDMIFDMIEMEMAKDEEFGEAVLKERNRKKGDEDINLFVKNIENVQGDERDIIIFSTGYAKNSKGKLVHHFGSLSQAGGENRLNVAISRAKKKIYVVTSFEPEELNVENSKQIGPRRFKEYLQYVRAVDQNQKGAQELILKSMVDLNSEGLLNHTVTFDSPFEEEVYESLIRMGYEVHTQVGASGYRIDLGVYDTETSSYIVGIECDGRAYHSSKSARERDIHRQKFLESRGWNILRIWSTDWWNDKDAIIENLKSTIDQMVYNKKELFSSSSGIDLRKDA